MFELTLQRQQLTQDAHGRNGWQPVIQSVSWQPSETALLICDMWDQHWSRGAMLREAAMLPRFVRTIAAARAQGALIIHAPSNTLEFYAGAPVLERATSVPQVAPPPERQMDDPPLPIDDSDGGSDTNHGDETPNDRVWTRQHPDIPIDQDQDIMADDGRVVYSYMQHAGIRHLLIAGVHTNMCILNRSFAIKQMVRWGVEVALVRDLTDTMYNPERPPYVSHERGTALVVGYIERFWCPTVTSEQILGDET